MSYSEPLSWDLCASEEVRGSMRTQPRPSVGACQHMEGEMQAVTLEVWGCGAPVHSCLDGREGSERRSLCWGPIGARCGRSRVLRLMDSALTEALGWSSFSPLGQGNPGRGPGGKEAEAREAGGLLWFWVWALPSGSFPCGGG